MHVIQKTQADAPSSPVLNSAKDLQQVCRATPARKLPYAPHQRVEFLNIQAETEALLQHLYIEHHRRKLATHQ
ncbi:MAG: hypothetical protein AAFR31_10955 [Cyanobacteria bacterium J06627_8]